jgi:hypothetical protein
MSEDKLPYGDEPACTVTLTIQERQDVCDALCLQAGAGPQPEDSWQVRYRMLAERIRNANLVEQSSNEGQKRGQLVCATCNDYHDEDSVCGVCYETALQIQREQSSQAV